MTPIRPSWIYSTRFNIPTIEAALFGFYAVRGKRLHKGIASAIFHASVQESHRRLQTWFANPNFCPITILRIVRSQFCQVEDYLKEQDPDKRRFIRICVKTGHGNTLSTTRYEWLEDDNDIHEMPQAWPCPVAFENFRDYTWIITVWLRINAAAALGPDVEKVERFINAHLPLVRYLDEIDDPRDEYFFDTQIIDQLYNQLGRSYYDEDRNFITTETQRFPCHTPLLDILYKKWPFKPWTVETMITYMEKQSPEDQCRMVQHVRDNNYDLWPTDQWSTHKIYYACLVLMIQCKDLHGTAQNAVERDALWFYHCCFIDLIYNCGGKDDKWLMSPLGLAEHTPMEVYYPFDNRAFTGYDLPDVFHVIMTIPLLAEHTGGTFKLWKFIQKSLPYCCARRTLISHTIDHIATDTAFWKVFSSVFYCMLMDAYPFDMSVRGHRERTFNLRHLIAAKRLSTDRDLMREALGRKELQARDPTSVDVFKKENDKGCHIVFTAFRLWVIMLVRGQHHYIQFAGQFIDWNAFCQQTFQMAQEIRKCVLDSPDPFSYARFALTKAAECQVYRYRKSNIVETVLKMFSTRLEKVLFRSGNYEVISPLIKQNILNLFVRMPQEQWLTPLGLSVLRVPDYGNVSTHGIIILLNLISIYFDSAKPQEFEKQLMDLDTNDFQVFTWFFNVISIVQNIQFQPLSEDQVRSIDHAMMYQRHMLFSGQALPRHTYSVFMTVCCREIKTLMGSRDFGQADVAFDMDHGIFVCTKGHKKITLAADLTEVGFETTKKQNRDERKRFNFIACKNTPVLDVNLRGFCLIHKNKERFMHCPSCGAFHKYDIKGWCGSTTGRYRCPECITGETFVTCAICGIQLESMTSNILEVVDPLSPNGSRDIFQRLYFCKRHYAVGKHQPWGIPKPDLFKKISNKAKK